MGNEAQLKARVERRESNDNRGDNEDKSDDKNTLSNRIQDEMRRQNLEMKDSKEKRADERKPDSKHAGPKDFEIIDFSATPDSNKDSNKDSKVKVENLPQGGRQLRIENSDGRTSQAIYDAEGNLSRYRDFNGREYERKGDHFVNRSNPVQQSDDAGKDGVDIKVDEITGSAELTDRRSGIKRTTDSNGVETTDYSATGGGKTITETKDSFETISIESINRQSRKLTIEHTETGARVQEYTDGTGNTYRCTGENDAEGKPKYVGVDKEGNASNHDFRITADRSGNVVVRDETLGKDDKSYARRELNNGTIVTSSGNKDDGSRRIVDTNGNEVAENSPEEEQAVSSKLIQEVPPDVDLKSDAEQVRIASATGNAYKYYLFKEMVQTGGPWDYKSPRLGDNLVNKEYEDFGNWHYGYVGEEAGIPSSTLQQRAGVEQIKQGTSKPEWGKPSWGPGGCGEGLNPFGGSGTYGDDPHDNEVLRKGIADREKERETEVADHSWFFTPILV